VPRLAAFAPMPRVEIIVNSQGGSFVEDETEASLRDALEAAGVDGDITLAAGGDEIFGKARDSSADILGAAGGDGTINAVASVALERNKPLAVVPLGTLNHFAKDIGVQTELAEAAAAISLGYLKSVDVGEVNGQIFLNNSSIGLYPSIVHERQQKERLGHGKWPAFIWAAFSVLRRYPFLDVRLNVEGKEIKSRTPFVFVGNNEYNMESFEIGGRARLDRGQLSIYFSHRTRRLELMALGLRALLAQVEKAEKFVAMTATEVSIETPRRRIRVSTDGEVTIMRSPLLYRVRPGALRVAVPKLDEADGA